MSDFLRVMERVVTYGRAAMTVIQAATSALGRGDVERADAILGEGLATDTALAAADAAADEKFSDGD